MSAPSLNVWQYTDERGTLVVVDALEKVPPSRRDEATQVTLTQRPASITPAQRAVEAADVHWPSFGAGVVVALGVVLVARVVWSGAKIILKVAAFAAVAALLVAGYFGVLRNQAGLGGGLASPAQILEDAQRAAEQAKKKIDKQGQDLRKIEGR